MTTTQATHTPTPWEINSDSECRIHLNGAHGAYIGTLHCGSKDAFPLAFAESRANAAHILKCVNERDDLEFKAEQFDQILEALNPGCINPEWQDIVFACVSSYRVLKDYSPSGDRPEV